MILILALAAVQQSREVLHSEGAVELRVPVSTETRHRASVVTFPEESLEALVAGWNEGDISVERRRENLFIKLLRPAEGDVHVLGGSGTLYRLAVRPADGAYDGRVRILRPAAPARREGAPESVDLIRAMRLGRRPSDGEVRRADEVVHRSAEIVARLAYIYETRSHRGFVVRVENVSGGPIRLDPSRFTAADLVMAGAREMLLKPGERTSLYLIFWKRP